MIRTTLTMIFAFGAIVLTAAEEKLAVPATIAGTGAPGQISPDELTAFKSRLLGTTTRHLDSLASSPDKLQALKGKSAAGMTALAFYLTFEATGNQSYRVAAVRLADQILRDMKATKFGVLFIKEKEKGSGEDIDGGGPPALGWYAAALAYVYHREGGRDAELRYVATVLDQFPWNEKGWWAATIDIQTGQSKQPLTKPSPVNKNAALAMAVGMTASYMKAIDSTVAASLQHKAAQCIDHQIIPAQEKDGFWHYGLTGNDPKGKDVLGYFMLTTGVLLQLQQFNRYFRDEKLTAALHKAGAFAQTTIAPMTEPNHGSPPRHRMTTGTPLRFTLPDDLKRAFQLGVVLVGTRQYAEGMKIVDAALKQFPFGDRGQDGGQAVYSTALIHTLLNAVDPQ